MKRNAIAIACAAVLAIALLLPAGLMGKLQPESAVRDAINSEVADPSASQQAPMPEQQEQSTGEAADSSGNPPDEPEYIPGVVLVGISDDASIDQVNERLQQLDFVATKSISEEELLYGYAEITLAEGVEVDDAVALLEAEDFATASQPNYVYHLLDTEEVESASDGASSAAANADGPLVAQHIDMNAQATSINDPYGNQQWGLTVIKAYDAWDNAKGNHKVTVAVLDSGLDMNHPDFADANKKTNVVSPFSVLQAKKHGSTSNVADALGHGTHVAGIISAGTNNGVGVAGVSYNANIMPVQVIEYPVVVDGKTTNRVTSADAAAGVNYIVNHKNADPSAPVRVINVSFGTTSSYTPGEGDDKLFTSALKSARQADILVVYAAGNGGSNGAYTCFPCDADPDGIGVISVQQSGSTYTRVSSSNYNQSGKMTKELSAPGQTIYSTWIDSTYKNDNGTSMAAPFVSGTAALMFAVAKDKNISLTAQEVKDILCSTAQDLNTSGFDLQTGYGLIDAKAAVNEVVNGSIKGASTVIVGGSVQLTLTQGTASSWTSSDTSVATVNSSGLVSARKVGTTTITAVRNGKKLYHTLTVQANSIQSCTVSLPSTPAYYTYNGKAQEPAVTVKYGSTTLKKGTDYTVTYSNNVKVGTATVRVTGIGSYKDSVSKTFTIKGTISQVMLSPTTRAYTGSAVKPTLTVKGSDGSTLSSGAYTATYYNNVNAGTNTAYVIVRGVSNGKYTGSKTARFSIADNGVQYRTHVQNDGWQSYVSNGATSGTSGRALRLEGINIHLSGQLYTGSIEYRTHIQNIGWESTWKRDDQMSGTSGRALRLEAIQIRLTGDMAKHYDVYYRVHCQNIGWMSWAKNGESAGSEGFGYRLEAIQIKLVSKGGLKPSMSPSAATTQQFVPFVKYRTHVQDYGWQGYVRDGAVSGTSGKAKRLEGINISLGATGYSGSILYRTHVQNYGWEKYWKVNGAMSGTSGEAKRLEAIQIQLAGEVAQYYDVYYRVHCQNLGWMGWAKNGASAGIAGYAYRLEAIQIKLVPKGSSAPGSTANAFRQR